MTTSEVAGAQPRPPRSSARRTERGIALVVPAMRGVVLVQVLLSVPAGLAASHVPPAYAALTAAAVVVSVVLVVSCLWTGSVRTGAWRYPDVAVAWVALPAMHLLLPTTLVTGSWEAWAPGYAINVAAAAATWLPTRAAVGHGLALGAWYLLWTSVAGTETWLTSTNDALTVPGYALVLALTVRYLRALADDADRMREDAVAATRALEHQRYQLTVHDATSVLRQLSDEQTPAEVLPGLRVQADLEARRLRNYLADPAPGATPGSDTSRTVGSMLAAALEGFDDLPLDLALDLGAHAGLDEDAWRAARGAVATLLHNVRLHAHADHVVLHADTDGPTWEVVVSDDGVGFDPADRPMGFGLRTQVLEALAACGASVEVRSSPGQGTSVTVVGPVGHGEAS